MSTGKGLSSPFGRGAVIATVAALVLAAIAPTEASARARRWHGGGGAAAVAGIVGTGLAIAAAQNRRAYYDDYYSGPYNGSPAYSAPGVYYGGGYGYYGDPSYGPGPYGYGTTVPYVNGHPVGSW
jgi:hypothetical protein